MMTKQQPAIWRVLGDELLFAVGNWLPRRALTRGVHRLARWRVPWLQNLLISIWCRFGGLDLSEAETTRFETLNDCFTRRLRPGARTIADDPSVIVSPCDGIVVALGDIQSGTLLQAKRHRYDLHELLCDRQLADYYRGGNFITLRLTPTMYHRFHAPDTGYVERVDWLPGDLWNVHPPALARVPRLYCRNERAVIRLRLAADQAVITLVPVAAILVGSLRIACLEELLHPGVAGPRSMMPRDARTVRGGELGWFEQGSTIIVVLPLGIEACGTLRAGDRVRMGQALAKRTVRETTAR